MLVKLGTPTYVLRTCNADMTAPHDGKFIWPEEGYVEAPDWRLDSKCGGGLHGALMGEGASSLLNWSADAKWLVVEIDHYIELGGKVKFRHGNVVFSGDRSGATKRLHDLVGNRAIIGAVLTGGYGSTLTGGDRSTLTGGNRSTLTGGNRSTLTGGDGSTLTGGNRSTLTGGYGSTLTGGNRSTLTGGYGSTLTGGDGSTLVVKYFDQSSSRYRRRLYEVGEDGIRPNVPYRSYASGRLVATEAKV